MSLISNVLTEVRNTCETLATSAQDMYQNFESNLSPQARRISQVAMKRIGNTLYVAVQTVLLAQDLIKGASPLNLIGRITLGFAIPEIFGQLSSYINEAPEDSTASSANAAGQDSLSLMFSAYQIYHSLLQIGSRSPYFSASPIILGMNMAGLYTAYSNTPSTETAEWSAAAAQ